MEKLTGKQIDTSASEAETKDGQRLEDAKSILRQEVLNALDAPAKDEVEQDTNKEEKEKGKFGAFDEWSVSWP